MVHAETFSASYRVYVLLVLVLTCISNLAIRNLPTFLVTVPIPACQRVCAGIADATQCRFGKEVSIAAEDTQSPHYQACLQCRANFERATTFQVQPHNDVTPRLQDMRRKKALAVHHKDKAEAGNIFAQQAPLVAVGQAKAASRMYTVVEVSSSGDQRLSSTNEIAEGVMGKWARVRHRAASPIIDFMEMASDMRAFPASSTSSVGRVLLNTSQVAEPDEALHLQSMGYFNMADGVCMEPWQYGLFVGYGFAIVFAAGSLVAGQICDRYPRVAVLSIAVVTWSVAMAMQAAAHTFTFILICRGITGLAQAFATPAAISITIDYFAERQSAAAVMLSVGLYLGSGLASFSALLAEDVGWRWVVLLSGLSGTVIALVLYFTVQEPDRTEWCAPCSLPVVTHEVFDKSRIARLLLVAASCKMLAAYTLGAFLPLWYASSGLQGYSTRTYAAWNMLTISSAGLLSTLIGGLVSNVRDPRAPCWVGAIGSAVSLPLLLGVLGSRHFCASLTYLFLLLVVSDSWLGPAVGLLRSSVRRSVQGQAVSVFLVASTLVANIGPAIVGFLDPHGPHFGSDVGFIAGFANLAAIAAFVRTAREVSIDPVTANVGVKLDSILLGLPPKSWLQQPMLAPPSRATPWFF